MLGENYWAMQMQAAQFMQGFEFQTGLYLPWSLNIDGAIHVDTSSLHPPTQEAVMCGFKAEYAKRCLEQKVENLTHLLDEREARLVRHHRFIAEENKRTRGLLSRWLAAEMGRA